VTYVNTGLTSGATYTYYVKAISGATAATASNVITVKVAAPDAPTGLANTSVTRILVIDQVGLSWTQPGTAPASSTQVQWATNVGFTTGVGSQTINGSGTSGTVTVGRGLGGTPNPANLYFRVRSINPVGNSVYSTAIGPIAMK
jgi:predicted phage tail protein